MDCNRSVRDREAGVTLLIVAFSLIALVAMAALAIDVASLYAARGEAQRAANAAALAGAKMFVTSSYTSFPGAWVDIPKLCTNSGPPSDGAVNRLATAAASANKIAGQDAQVQSISCNLATNGNPRVTVTVRRIGVPTFFARPLARLLGTADGISSVSASATAEAYNSSYVLPNRPPIALTNVKPWLIPNCDPSGSVPCDGTHPYFLDSNGGIGSGGAHMGMVMQLSRIFQGAPKGSNAVTPPRLEFYGLHYPDSPAPTCPARVAPCGPPVGAGDPYIDGIACTSRLPFYCGQKVGQGSSPEILAQDRSALDSLPTEKGTKCLIHSDAPGLGQGQDIFDNNGVAPVEITGGTSNPNVDLHGRKIDSSDSVVTVPLYRGGELCVASGANGACPDPAPGQATVIGFLQLGIMESEGGPILRAVILNAVGCSPDAIAAYELLGPPTNALSSGGSSPIPVRLIQAP